MQVTILNYRFSVFQFQFSIVNYQLNKFMAFRKDNKIKSNFSKISIGLASPEEILENSSGEVLKPETINAVSTSVSVTKASSATVVVWK